MAKKDFVPLKKVSFEYEDGTIITFNEANDPILGNFFFNMLKTLQEIPSLKTTITKKTSLTKRIKTKLSNWLKV